MTNSSTLHFTIKEDGKLYYLPEVPEKCRECDMVIKIYPLCEKCQEDYDLALQKAKDNAIEVGNKEEITKLIYNKEPGRYTGYDSYFKVGTIYTLTGSYSVEIKEQPLEHLPLGFRRKLAFIKLQEPEKVWLREHDEEGNQLSAEVVEEEQKLPEETQEQLPISVIDFAVWYSGMERHKVINAYRRYQREVVDRKQSLGRIEP